MADDDATAEVVSAERLGLATATGWAFRDVTVTISSGQVVAVAGPPGSGRSSLVQALTARTEPTEGTLRFFGRPPGHAVDEVRAQIAAAALPDHVALHPTISIRECVADHLLLTDVPRSSDVFDAAADVVQFRPDLATAVADLPVLQYRLLGLALALTSPMKLIACDDVESGLSVGDTARLWAGLQAAAATGPAVVAGTGRPPPWADQVITLHAAWHG